MTKEDSNAPFELEIEKLVFGGDGLGRCQGKVVFVPFTAAGDRVEVTPVEQKKGFIRGTATGLLRPGPGRTDAICPLFRKCGGCQWQHIEYALQVETKQKILQELFHHRFPETRQLAIGMRPCPEPYGYRSRARLQVRTTKDGPMVGFFRPRSKLVEDVASCPLFRPALNEALSSVRNSGLEGRFGSEEKELELACSEDGRWASADAETAVSVADSGSQDVLPRQVEGFCYETSPSVFFQANDFMVAELVKEVVRLAAGHERALDLYSGVGLFTLPLARRFRNVVAIEGSRQAHLFCAKNASGAGLENIDPVCAEVGRWVAAAGSIASPACDLILLDPPRAGAGPEVIKRLVEWAPETILYVSCDPQTLLRDLASVPPREYAIDWIQGLDLFPQTFHLEAVVRLRRR